MPREEGKVYNRVERSAANRLYLLERAKGDYCGFLDGDDFYIREDKLQKQVDILEKRENLDCIMCAHNLLLYYEDGSETPLCKAKKERKITLQEYWPLMFLQANAILFRNIWKEHPPTGILAKNFDDNNITFWLFQYGKMYYLPEFMGAYRQVSGSSWNAIDKIQKASSNVLGYSVEISVNEDFRTLSDIRHYPDFQCIYENRNKISKESCMPFYQTAKENNVQEALWIYELDEEDEASVAKLRKRISKGKAGYLKAKMLRGMKKVFRCY
jgi:glycosyltransferase involved in cell wall biosynthesis